MPSVITWTIVPPMPQGPNVILLGLVIQKPMPTPYPLRHIPSLRDLGLSGSATDITSFPTKIQQGFGVGMALKPPALPGNTMKSED